MAADAEHFHSRVLDRPFQYNNSYSTYQPKRNSSSSIGHFPYFPPNFLKDGILPNGVRALALPLVASPDRSFLPMECWHRISTASAPLARCIKCHNGAMEDRNRRKMMNILENLSQGPPIWEGTYLMASFTWFYSSHGLSSSSILASTLACPDALIIFQA